MSLRFRYFSFIQNVKHVINFDAVGIFKATSIDQLPSQIDYINAINLQYDYTLFVSEYLHKVMPQDSIFRYSEFVG